MASLNRDWLGSVLTIKVIFMKNITISIETQGAIAKYVSGANAADKKRGHMIDLLWADGVRSTHLATVKDGGSKDVVATLNAAIVLGFTATERHLLDSPIKSLKEHQKEARRYLQQQVGSRRNDIKKALIRREGIEAAGGDATAPRTPKTPEQRLLERLAALHDSITKIESPTFSPVRAVNLLKELTALVSGLSK